MDSNYQGSYGGFNPNNMGNNATYTVDMVFCIDSTGSMESTTGEQKKIINVVKENALNFYTDFKKKMEEEKKPLAQLRVRVISFRDYIADGPYAMKGTDFFLLPQQAAEFEECINGIHAEGGGDIPEDGLEALAYAMKSKWTTQGIKKRQVIVVWTDAGTHVLGFGKGSPYYPKGMPANLAELEDWWEEMDHYARRLVIFSPLTNYWNYIIDNFEQAYHMETMANAGMADCGYDKILNMLVKSLS
ncbi:MAG: VWA domain-containing protein [Lachnospiraceae bacterium]|nr:VWA domain-containing protein [Lachnospiraceae bacterium]